MLDYRLAIDARRTCWKLEGGAQAHFVLIVYVVPTRLKLPRILVVESYVINQLQVIYADHKTRLRTFEI